jgi:hypothetical protein
MPEKTTMKRNLKFTFRSNIDTIVAYEFYESRRKNLGESFLDELNDCYKSIILNYTTYKIVHKIFRQAVLRKFPFVVLYSVDEKDIVITAVFSTIQNPNKKFK